MPGVGSDIAMVREFSKVLNNNKFLIHYVQNAPLEACHAAIRIMPLLLKYVSPCAKTYVVCRAAVEKTAVAVCFCADSTCLSRSNYEELCYLALQKCAFVIDLIENPTDRMRAIAIRTNGAAWVCKNIRDEFAFSQAANINSKISWVFDNDLPRHRHDLAISAFYHQSTDFYDRVVVPLNALP